MTAPSFFKRFRHDPNRIAESRVDTAVRVVNALLLLVGVVLVAFPILSYFALAFSNGAYNLDIVLFPKGWTVKPFIYIFTGAESQYFWRSVLNSVIITAAITIGSNLVEAFAAYPLSKKDCPFRGGILMYFIVTMLFSAGIVPIYLWMHMLNLLDNIASIILVSISNVFNLLLFKTFFEGLPSDIEEAAKLDGASELQMFFQILLPMSLPVVGSCCFFSMVGSWNSYGSALMFISSGAKDAYPLAYYIYNMVNVANINKTDSWVLLNVKNIQSAAMLVSIIPILCFYPYIVKYIKSGITVGSVKG